MRVRPASRLVVSFIATTYWSASLCLLCILSGDAAALRLPACPPAIARTAAAGSLTCSVR